VVDRGYGASATFTRQLAPQVPASLTYRFELNQVEGNDLYFCVNFGVCEVRTIGSLRETNRLSPMTLTTFADRADDPLAPRSGWTARLEVEHASEFTASDFRYNRAAAEFARYFKLGRGTLAGHIRGGWIHASQSTAQAVNVTDSTANLLHPSRRFYAGGARSVRGFAENQLGPRVLTIDPHRLLNPDDSTQACTDASVADGSCDPNIVSSRFFVPRPVGGNSLTEASIEYRMPLTKSLIGALFVDAGRVAAPSQQSLTKTRTAWTPGVGIRYNSPVGPIRIDLGMRPSNVEDLPVVTQIADTTAGLRLVHLQTRMHYDPLDTKSGWLRKALARFQLHLAIGEAF
jgi:outer membrane protein assembly factor BamA